jgi:hypothetical protein
MCGSRFDLRLHRCSLLGQRRLHRSADSSGLGSNVLCEQKNK